MSEWYIVSDTTAEKIVYDRGYETSVVKASHFLAFSDKDSAGKVVRWNQLRWNVNHWEMRHEDM